MNDAFKSGSFATAKIILWCLKRHTNLKVGQSSVLM